MAVDAVGHHRRHDRLPQILVRRSRLPAFPDTWEKYREVGKTLKAKGRPIGQTLGHTFGDSPTFTYPYLWSWGGKEVEDDGKVVINKGDGRVGQVHDRFLEGRA